MEQIYDKQKMRDAQQITIDRQNGLADHCKGIESLRRDAERYRWLRENPTWLGYDADYRPDEIDSAVDREMKVPNDQGNRLAEGESSGTK